MSPAGCGMNVSFYVSAECDTSRHVERTSLRHLHGLFPYDRSELLYISSLNGNKWNEVLLYFL